MITREEYLNALDIIERYFRQEKAEENTVQIKTENKKNLRNARIGDYIVYDKRVAIDIKDITFGKKYAIQDILLPIDNYPYDDTISIINDKGRIRRINRKNHYGRWSWIKNE